MIPARSYMFLVKVLCSTFWRYKYLSLQYNFGYPIYFSGFSSKRFLFCSISPRDSVVVGDWRASYGPKLERLGFPWWRVRYVTAVTSQFRQPRYLRHFHLEWVQSSFQTEVCVYNSSLYRSDWTDCTTDSSHIFLSFNLPAQPSPAVVREWQFETPSF